MPNFKLQRQIPAAEDYYPGPMQNQGQRSQHREIRLKSVIRQYLLRIEEGIQGEIFQIIKAVRQFDYKAHNEKIQGESRAQQKRVSGSVEKAGRKEAYAAYGKVVKKYSRV